MLVDSPPLAPVDNARIVDPPQDVPCAADEFRRRGHLLSGSNTVVTSSDDGDWFGVASSSVCALSYETPTLVACVRRRSRIGRELGRTRQFCVNILPPDQLGLAQAFTGAGEPDTEQFLDADWTRGSMDTPVLNGAPAAFECEVDLIYGYPDDLIVVGVVRHVTGRPQTEDTVPAARRHGDGIPR